MSDGKEEKKFYLNVLMNFFSFMGFTDHNVIDNMSISDINVLYESLYEEKQRVSLIEGIEFDVFDFAKYLAFWVIFQIIIQAEMNLMVVVGMIPVTGVTLTFLSYECIKK